MLSTQISGPGSGGERFDQLREDLQVCLQLKRAVHEARGCLDGVEQREADCKEELKGGADKVRDLERAIEEAKKHAKAKADAWVEVNSGDKETECFAQSQRDQRVAGRLQEQLQEAESGASRAQQDMNRISRDIAKLEGETKSARAKMDQLKDRLQVASAQIAELPGALQAEGERAQLASERRALEEDGGLTHLVKLAAQGQGQIPPLASPTLEKQAASQPREHPERGYMFQPIVSAENSCLLAKSADAS
ncbi:unnamed protein product [Prorocentrum cordatum]|uniref:Uncharacterized protein n=1 Tax=Prorocentrum cordatum TaxID=2364126 RepID=A0ABN9RQS5_9DINO|nr:unnamed protein product [Polarella glacialis]